MTTAAPTERKLLADTGKLSSATGLAHAINLVGGLVLAGLLGPAAWGVWKYVQIVHGYTGYANLGATNGIDRSCPALVSKGKLGLYRRLINGSLVFSTAISTTLALGFLAAGLLAGEGTWRTALVALAALVFLQPFFQHGEAALAAEKRFGAKAKAILGSSLFRVGISILAAYLFGLAGVLAVLVVTLAAVSVYMFSATTYGWPWRAFLDLRPRLPRGIVRVGLPITLLAFAEQLFLTADKWIVGGIFGGQAGGWYLFAVFPLPVLLMVPSTLRQIVSIDVYDKYSRLRRLDACRDVFERSVMAIALGSPLMIGAVWFGLPWLIDMALHQYRPAIDLVKVHAVLAYPVLISQTALPIVVVMRRVRGAALGYLAVGALASAASVWWLATATGASMMTVLAIHGAAWGLFAAGLLGITLVWFGDSVPWAAWRVVRWLLPMAFLAVELPAVDWVLGQLPLVPHSFVYAATGGLLHTVACAPWLWMLERRVQGVSFVLARLRRR